MKDYRLIPLTGKRGTGKFAKVSPEDYEYVNQYNWNLDKYGYANTSVIRELGFTRKTAMHALVAKRMGILKEVGRVLMPDHINRNKLDNQRSNIRIATFSQNMVNSGIPSNNKTGYKGVSYSKVFDGYYVTVGFEKVRYNVSGFKTALEAALARDALVRYYHGEFGVTNFEGSEAYDVYTARQKLRAKQPRSSIFFGVSRHSKCARWVAITEIKGQQFYLGLFVNEKDAALAIDTTRVSKGLPPINFP